MEQIEGRQSNSFIEQKQKKTHNWRAIECVIKIKFSETD